MSTLIDREITELCKGHAAMLDPFSATRHTGPPSWGLSSAGYDIRIGEEFAVYVGGRERALHPGTVDEEDIGRKLSASVVLYPGNFMLAETIERFRLPDDIYATVHDKSSWIRLGLSVHNTVIEPGWRGVLTLELKNNNPTRWIEIKKGDGIAQMMFHRLSAAPGRGYGGQYQDQLGLTIPGQRAEA